MKTAHLFFGALLLNQTFACANAQQAPLLRQLNLPIVSTKYTADPAPYVHGDTIYLFTTHDEDGASNFELREWLLYTSTDMVNWTDHGAVASLRDFKWYGKDNGAWAPQVIERNGKWYMYCPIHGNGICVLMADSPYGPFHDPLGEPLVWQREHWDDIDPTVWIDADGQAYMYWGNPDLYCVRLNEDMISTRGDIAKLPKIEDYQEGPWFYYRDGHYYMAFASTCCPEGIGYAMSDSPTGPWQYKGHIMDHTVQTRGNHPGIIDFKGRSYLFGLNYDVFRFETSRHAEQRSVSAAELTYNADGTIRQLPYFLDCQLRQIGTLNPFRRVEAETMRWGRGLKTTRDNPSGPRHNSLFVTDIDEGEFIMIQGVNMGDGAQTFTACVSAGLLGGSIELHIDDLNGPVIGRLEVPYTHFDYEALTTTLSPEARGTHDLYLVFCGNELQKRNLFNFDWWEMK